MPINYDMSTDNKNEPLLRVENLTVKFDNFIAVDDISLSVKPGEVLGILGGNGAGKSTTLKVIGGILRPTSGNITVDDLNFRKNVEANKIRSITGYCPDVGGLINGATPREHVKLLLTLHNKPELYEQGIKLISMFALDEFIDVPSSGFSHGMSRRLSVLLATLASQKLLILDEPFDGVDPLGVNAINETIKQAKENGLAIIVSTHLQELLVGVADNIIVMEKSKIVASAPSHKFKGAKGRAYYEALLSQHEINPPKQTFFARLKNIFTKHDGE